VSDCQNISQNQSICTKKGKQKLVSKKQKTRRITGNPSCKAKAELLNQDAPSTNPTATLYTSQRETAGQQYCFAFNLA